MIKKIVLNNFKCFEKLELPFGAVNIFTGMNGMGKSTVIQSLLLLRQSYLENKDMSRLILNGKYVQLGNGNDILYEKAAEEKIGINCTDKNGEFVYSYQYDADADKLPAISEAELTTDMEIIENGFSYLSAYRIKPENAYSIANEKELEDREFGNNGEFAIQYLSLHDNNDVILPSVILDDRNGKTIMNQTKLWMNRISPGVFPNIKIDKKLRRAELYYEFIEGRNKTNSYKSINVGFGITYALPIIVSVLSSKPGDIIVIENPEAHIHPAGQRMLGELIALAGNDGVQMIVETHSDHILNGIRVTVKQGRVSHESINISFFDRNPENYSHEVEFLKLDQQGRIDRWPVGFFDEWDNALLELL